MVDNSVFGEILASEKSEVKDVLTYAEAYVKPTDLLEPVPATAELWEEVQHITGPAMVHYRDQQFLDLRRPPWEALQDVRLVPLLGRTGAVRTLVFSAHSSPQTVQMRLSRSGDRAIPNKP